MGESEKISSKSPLLGADEKKPFQEAEKMSVGWEFSRGLALFLTYACIGMYCDIIGPILPQLTAQTNSDYGTMTQALCMRGVGFAVGGFIGGMLVDKLSLYNDLSISLLLGVYACLAVSMSYTRQVAFLYPAYLLDGTLQSYVTTVAYRMTLMIWKEKAGTKILMMFGGYSLGSAVIPLIVEPFLDERFSFGAKVSHFKSKCHFDEAENGTSFTDAIMPYPASFVIPYWIVAGLSFLVCAVFLGFHIHGRTANTAYHQEAWQKTNTPITDLISVKGCSEKHPKLAVLLIILMACYTTASVPLARAFPKFVYSIARDGPCMDIKSATTMQTEYFAAVVIGRCVSVLVASFVHMNIFLPLNIFLLFMACTLLSFLHTNITALWVLMGVTGFFSGPATPSMCAWANNYMEVTAAARIVPHVGAAIGDALLISLMGSTYDSYGPDAIWLYVLALGFVLLITTPVMLIVGCYMGDRFKETKK